MSFRKRLLCACLLQEFRDESRPACLMTRAQADSRVAVEIFVKEDQVTPVWVVLVTLRRAERRARPIGTSQEQARETLGQLRGNLPEREHPAGTRRALDLQAIAVRNSGGASAAPR